LSCRCLRRLEYCGSIARSHSVRNQMLVSLRGGGVN
jgi:hypothetical protein